MHEKYFTIKNYPNDVYKAVGELIKISQEWEQDYKGLARKLNVNIKNINRLNIELKKHNLISEKEFSDLDKVISYRNYINHEFYLTDFQNSFGSYEQKITYLENILNVIRIFIFEATDVINNKIDKLNGGNAIRPTIFDSKK